MGGGADSPHSLLCLHPLFLAATKRAKFRMQVQMSTRPCAVKFRLGGAEPGHLARRTMAILAMPEHGQSLS